MSKTTIPTGGITADAIDGTLIADDAINSEHYTDGSIDTAHIGDSQVTAAKATGVGEYVKIANINTDSGTSMSFNDCFSDTYQTYLITFQFENDRNGNQIWMRFQKADDTTFNSNYRYACHQTNNGGTESSITSTGNTQWRMTGGTA